MEPETRDNGKREYDHDLIYGIMKSTPDFLLFIPRKEATNLAQIWDALHHAKTWGEFRSKMPADEYEDYMVRSFDDSEKTRPSDAEAFSPTEEGWEDGEWPTSPLYWWDSYVPRSIRALGTPIVNVFGGSWIYATHEAEALRILRDEGYKVERNDKLAVEACGDDGAGA